MCIFLVFILYARAYATYTLVRFCDFDKLMAVHQDERSVRTHTRGNRFNVAACVCGMWLFLLYMM